MQSARVGWVNIHWARLCAPAIVGGPLAHARPWLFWPPAVGSKETAAGVCCFFVIFPPHKFHQFPAYTGKAMGRNCAPVGRSPAPTCTPAGPLTEQPAVRCHAHQLASAMYLRTTTGGSPSLGPRKSGCKKAANRESPQGRMRSGNPLPCWSSRPGCHQGQRLRVLAESHADARRRGANQRAWRPLQQRTLLQDEG